MNATDWAHLLPHLRELRINGWRTGFDVHQFLVPIFAAIGSQLRSLYAKDGNMSSWQAIGQYCHNLVELHIAEHTLDSHPRGCETKVWGFSMFVKEKRN